MNKVFKSVWSEALGAWVAASELCRGRGKGGGKTARAVALVIGLSVAGGAFAQSNGVTAGPNAVALHTTDIAVGPGATAQSKTKDAIAIGDAAKSIADGATAIGAGVTAAAAYSTVIGNAGAVDSASTATVFFAPNGGTVSGSANSFAFNPYGQTGTSASADSVNISGTVANAPSSVAIGSHSLVSGDSSVAIGAHAQVETNNSVAIGDNSIASDPYTVSIGNSNNQRKLVQVANGTQANDAVNVSQIQGITQALGGGAGVDSATGKITLPIYTIQGVQATGVGSAIGALDRGLSKAVDYDGTKDSVTLAGTAGTQIHKLAAATEATDAVNFGQLTDAGLIVDSTGVVTNAFVAYTDKSMSKVSLGGTGGTTISNVAAGVAPQDAVNVKQLTDSGAVVDSTGTVTNAFVAYDGTTKDSVTLKGSNGTQIHKVAAGVAPQDAVNVKQLTDSGAVVDSTGTVTNAFVAYDGTTKDSVTLKGSNGTQIHKVAAGVAPQDAVNVKQLTDSGAVVDSTGTVTNAFVAYDGTTKDSVTLKGSNGTQIHKVAAGVAPQDAVNVKQLTDSGAVVDSTGTVTNAFVAYDGTTKDAVTLKGTAGTQIHNVAAGTVDMDAVNVKQLTDAGAIVDSTGSVTNAFVAYDGTTKDAVTLKGTDGTQIHNLAAGTVDMDAVNVKQLTDAGAIVDSTGSVTNAFVAYDGTTKDSVTLKGTDGTQIHNLAAGTVDMDAVNVKQLTDAGAIVDSTGSVTNAFVAYDGTTKDSVTLKGTDGTQIHNLAAGTVDMDAVNVKQLTDAGAIVDSTGSVTNAFVAYDGTTKDSVTLKGTDGTQIHNVAAGAADMDAVNLKQLTDAGITVDTSGNVTNSFVAYDDGTQNSVTLKGANGTVIHNVANGDVSATSKDAINGSQLYEATQNMPAFADSVNYASPAHDSIALVSTAGGAVTISGVAAGAMTATSSEAVNGAQLFAVDAKTNQNTADITNINKTINNIVNGGDAYVSQDAATGVISVGGNTNGNEVNVAGTAGARKISGVAAGSVSASSDEAVNGSQLYNTAASTAAALGGGAGVDANGGITAPTYTRAWIQVRMTPSLRRKVTTPTSAMMQRARWITHNSARRFSLIPALALCRKARTARTR
ncbi:ESPR-type extended signal peptide-containing protein [Caballeronia sp. SBC2]|uniref:ESPR-type extended signal peptide-containing protein n=1 Tax=Caballeronia sp. SBC2 TaxID=2705547 RepID=UPI0013E197E8|nr:ESPR-type extended signal peptide-containing protein [Caballeronia sp. SBC2]QIE25258.1 Autotransporter adhesin SadA [Caballeronia sp. SBC2]